MSWPALVFAGPDRLKFLNGLVTADVLELPAGRGTLCCLLAPKGLLRADFELYARDEDLVAISSPRAMANLKADLAKYLPLSETTMSEAGALSFEAAEAGAYEVRGETFASPRLGGRWTRGPGLDDAAFERRRIERGVPLYGVDMDETTLPQEARLDAALSFDKGCYLGQETVSRLHHMGRVKRKLVRLRVEGEPEPGAEVCAGEALVGRMTSRAGANALAMVRLAESAPGTALVVRSGGGAHPATVL